MRFIRSFSYAWQGIRSCYKREKNFRIQLFISLPVYCAGFYFGLSGSEWLAILFCTMLTLSLEMINSSIEKLADFVTSSIHPVIKQVKDIAAGAVLLSAIISIVMGCIIFIPKLKPFLK
jgi:undecaprenol kinase